MGKLFLNDAIIIDKVSNITQISSQSGMFRQTQILFWGNKIKIFICSLRLTQNILSHHLYSQHALYNNRLTYKDEIRTDRTIKSYSKRISINIVSLGHRKSFLICIDLELHKNVLTTWK